MRSVHQQAALAALWRSYGRCSEETRAGTGGRILSSYTHAPQQHAYFNGAENSPDLRAWLCMPGSCACRIKHSPSVTATMLQLCGGCRRCHRHSSSSRVPHSVEEGARRCGDSHLPEEVFRSTEAGRSGLSVLLARPSWSPTRSTRKSLGIFLEAVGTLA
jgi:hypothetical protein